MPPPFEVRLKKKFGWHGKKYVIVPKINAYQYLTLFISEFMASFGFLFLGVANLVPHTPITLLSVAIGFGTTVIVLIEAFNHISAQITPVVTIAAMVMGYTPILLFPFILFAQIVGAFAGYGALLCVTPSALWGNKLGARFAVGMGTVPAGVEPIQSMCAELIASGFLAIVCCAIWDHRNDHLHDSVPIKFGLTVTALALAVGHLSGCHLNPPRTLAPAVVFGNFENHWVWWAGPILGSLIFSVIYALFLQIPKEGGDDE